MIKRSLLIVIIAMLSLYSFSQEKIIDGVIAIVGSNMVLQSDIESQYLQYLAQGMKDDNNDAKCKILEELMFQKLLVLQAAIDSLKVTDAQVDEELDRRIRYFVKQLGSKEKLEEYYKKPLYQIKAEFRDVIKDMLFAQTMEQKITKDMKVTPGEVKAFYKNILTDSLPMIDSEIEIGQIVRQASISKDEKKRIRTKLTEIRDRIIAGEKFSTLAVLYSEDENSFKKGGDIGTHARGELIPEFEAIAFNLKENEVSPVIETPNAFYIIQLIDRKGEFINIRQIMLKPKVDEADLYKCKLKLDSILSEIKSGKLSFESAALKFSDDLQGKNNKGLMINPQTGNSKFQTTDIDQDVFFIIDKLDVGDLSEPAIYIQEDGKKAYRILYLQSRTNPHRANLKEDYDKIQTAALNQKKNDIINDWIKTRSQNTYIRIMDEYKNCTFKHNWLTKSKI